MSNLTLSLSLSLSGSVFYASVLLILGVVSDIFMRMDSAPNAGLEPCTDLAFSLSTILFPPSICISQLSHVCVLSSLLQVELPL